MSSSKIIKLADHGNTGIAEYNFRNIGATTGAMSSSIQSADGFVAMESHYFGGEEVVDAAPPLIEISEDELSQKTNEAFDAGLKEGKELAERGLINVFKALRASSETIHNLRDKIFRESEDELINLIMLVARKVIIQEIAQDRSILAGVVKNALSGLSAREEIVVHLNPEDYQLVTSGNDDLLKKELLNDRLLLKSDQSVATGFCHVETEMGVIDASLEGQMDHIYRCFLEQRTAAVVQEA